MGVERDGDDEEYRSREDAYSSARIGAAAALTIVLPVLLVLDVAVSDYDVSPPILLPILGAICALRQVDVLAAFVATGGSVADAAARVGVRPSTDKRHCETECPVHGWAGSPDWSRQRRG
jgi:hypothetical protein